MSGGSIVFTLTGPGGFTFTQTDPVSGNGTYTASTPLPTTGTVAGTYTWTAHYAGDANNNAANDQGGAAEQVIVAPTSPTLVTTASPALTLGTHGADPDRLGGAGGRPEPDRQHRLHADGSWGLHVYADGPGQRQRHLHGEHAAGDRGDGGGHL